MYTDNNTYLEILQDQNYKTQEKIDWKGRKMKNIKISESFKRLGYTNRYERIKECGTLLQFAECPNDSFKKLVRGNFCHDRLCPICNKQKSKILQYQISKMLEVIQGTQDLRFIFLTLTIENVSGNKLKEAIKNMMQAFNRFTKYKKFKDISLGYIRTLEVTRNDSNNNYHPHIHMIIAVKPSYFSDNTYLKTNDISKLWRKALKVNYDPIVDIRKVKPKNANNYSYYENGELVYNDKNSINIKSAILEVAKYSVKDTDYLCKTEKETDEVIKVLSSALKGIRLIGFSGIFKTVRTILKLQDIEDKNSSLILHNKDNHEKECPICGAKLEKSLYNWYDYYKNYFKLDITVEEMDKLFENSCIYKQKRLKKEKNKLSKTLNKLKNQQQDIDFNNIINFVKNESIDDIIDGVINGITKNLISIPFI